MYKLIFHVFVGNSNGDVTVYDLSASPSKIGDASDVLPPSHSWKAHQDCTNGVRYNFNAFIIFLIINLIRVESQTKGQYIFQFKKKKKNRENRENIKLWNNIFQCSPCTASGGHHFRTTPHSLEMW